MKIKIHKFAFASALLLIFIAIGIFITGGVGVFGMPKLVALGEYKYLISGVVLIFGIYSLYLSLQKSNAE